MRKVYHTPIVHTQKLTLGVFGDYGQGGEVNPPQPNRVVDRFEMHMD
jgi:hypothetical protein